MLAMLPTPAIASIIHCPPVCEEARLIGHICPSRCQQAIIGQPQLATDGVGLSYSTRSLLNVSVAAGGFAGVTDAHATTHKSADTALGGPHLDLSGMGLSAFPSGPRENQKSRLGSQACALLYRGLPIRGRGEFWHKTMNRLMRPAPVRPGSLRPISTWPSRSLSPPWPC